VTLTKSPDGCLLLFPRPDWEVFRAKVAALPMEAAWWQRIFLGNAMDVELDTAGRVLVSPELRSAASLEKNVTLLGMGNRFELWDADTYAAKEAAAMAQGMPEALKNFTF
jgi:MraZ protein